MDGSGGIFCSAARSRRGLSDSCGARGVDDGLELGDGFAVAGGGLGLRLGLRSGRLLGEGGRRDQRERDQRRQEQRAKRPRAECGKA